MSAHPMILPGNQPKGPILAFDTSTACMTAAVIDGGKLLAQRQMNADRNHSLYLMPLIGEVLDSLSISPAGLAGLAVGRGPGSYTGVRIGVTVAKTMAWTLKLPLLSVSSLEALALGGWKQDGPAGGGRQWIVPLMDARRGQAYTALYEGVQVPAADGGHNETADDSLQWSCLRNDFILPMETWLDELLELAGSAEQPPQRIAFVGDAETFTPLTERFASAWTGGEAAAYELGMRAYDIGRLAGERMALGMLDDPHELVPNYAQLSEAEVKLQEKRK